MSRDGHIGQTLEYDLVDVIAVALDSSSNVSSQIRRPGKEAIPERFREQLPEVGALFLHCPSRHRVLDTVERRAGAILQIVLYGLGLQGWTYCRPFGLSVLSLNRHERQYSASD